MTPVGVCDQLFGLNGERHAMAVTGVDLDPVLVAAGGSALDNDAWCSYSLPVTMWPWQSGNVFERTVTGCMHAVTTRCRSGCPMYAANSSLTRRTFKQRRLRTPTSATDTRISSKLSRSSRTGSETRRGQAIGLKPPNVVLRTAQLRTVRCAASAGSSCSGRTSGS